MTKIIPSEMVLGRKGTRMYWKSTRCQSFHMILPITLLCTVWVLLFTFYIWRIWESRIFNNCPRLPNHLMAIWGLESRCLQQTLCSFSYQQTASPLVLIYLLFSFIIDSSHLPNKFQRIFLKKNVACCMDTCLYWLKHTLQHPYKQVLIIPSALLLELIRPKFEIAILLIHVSSKNLIHWNMYSKQF